MQQNSRIDILFLPQGAHGYETDLWSLGSLLYTCLVGKAPFDSEGVKSTLNKVALGEYSLPSDLSKHAQDLIHKLLQKNPAERIDLHDILGHPFMQDPAEELMNNRGALLGRNMSANERRGGDFSAGMNSHPLSPPVKLKPNQLSGSHTPHNDLPPLRLPLAPRNNFDGNISSCSNTTSCSSCTQSPFSITSYSSASCGNTTTSDEELQRYGPCSVLTCTNKRSPISDKCSRCSHISDINKRGGGDKKSILSQNNKKITGNILSQKSVVNGEHSQLLDLQHCTISERPSGRSILKEPNSMYVSAFTKPSERGKENRDPTPRVQPQLSSNTSSNSLLYKREGARHLEEIMKPLCTLRLRPFRQKTSNTVTSILDDESISLEFIRKRDSVEYVMEVMRVSRDGIKVTVFVPHEKTILREVPLPVPPSAMSFAFAALPQKYWKKYQYADKFVRLVKTKTPKVTLYSSKAKCSLMESDREDFEALFYDGSKVNVSAQEYNIIDCKGNMTKIARNSNENDVDDAQRELLEHARTCHSQCQLLDSKITSLQTSDCYFPLVVGRRPHTAAKRTNRRRELSVTPRPQQSKPGSPDHTTPTAVSMMSYAYDDASVCTLTPQRQQQSQQQQQQQQQQSQQQQQQQSTRLQPPTPLPSKPRGPTRASSTSSLDRVGLDPDTNNATCDIVTQSAFVADVGWAQQLKSGEIKIQFNEGTQLRIVDPHSSWLRIVFIDEAGRTSRYNDLKTDRIPPAVMEKVALVQKFLNLLSQKQVAK